MALGEHHDRRHSLVPDGLNVPLELPPCTQSYQTLRAAGGPDHHAHLMVGEVDAFPAWTYHPPCVTGGNTGMHSSALRTA